MSQDPSQFPEAQGAGPQGYVAPPLNPYPAPTSKGGASTMTIVLIILGVILLLGILFCGVLAALLIPAVGAARDAAKRMQDSNNLKQIAIGVLNYESAYKKMPAPSSMNSKNEKVWSWSVNLLPFCEQTELFNKIDYRDMQPWDALSNIALQGDAPPYLRSTRVNAPVNATESNVFIISAPTKKDSGNPLFIDGTYSRIRECTDGTSNTILAIMLVKHSAPWASPTTLTVDEAYQLIQKEDVFFQAAFVDGSVLALPVTIDKATFEALVTRDGGEIVQKPVP